MKTSHQWKTFFNPRNARISIQACAICGVAKGLEKHAGECSSTTNINKSRLKNWTTVTPIAQQRKTA